MSKYIPTIGIETHVQLKTATKLFSAVGNDARDASPNTLISHICVGMPGALPVLNRHAVELSAKAAVALGTKPQKFSKFDRKHYFYPDLPKGYQISQFDQPIIIGGQVEVLVDGQMSTIGITRAHLEEDAGKNIHPEGADYSLVDLNRAGTPLLEIVSEPQIHSPAEAKAYARELYLLMKYSGVSDCDLYHGNMRFDVNVSLSKDNSSLGTRAEIKNLNSFRSVENAVAYEIKRQSELLDKGQRVVQETRGWDEAKQKTTPQRTKEEAHDYRYMPEPDVPPVELSDDLIKKYISDLPELPKSIRQKLTTLKIDEKVIEDILDMPEFVPSILDVLANSNPENAKNTAFWYIQSEDASKVVETKKLIELGDMLNAGKLSSTSAKAVFKELQKSAKNPAEIATDLKLIQVSDESQIESIVANVIAQNQKAAEDVKNGELKAIGFLVGQVMAKSKGQANPAVAQKLIKKHLSIEN